MSRRTRSNPAPVVEIKPDPIKYIERAEFDDLDGDLIPVDLDDKGNVTVHGIVLNRSIARALAGLLLRYADGGTIRA